MRLSNRQGRLAMRKTTIELTDEQYFFLKEKVLDLQKQKKNGSIVAIIRELIDQAILREKKSNQK